MDKIFTVALLRDLEQQVTKGDISYSRMVEILNEFAASKSKEDNLSLMGEIEKLKEDLENERFWHSNFEADFDNLKKQNEETESKLTHTYLERIELGAEIKRLKENAQVKHDEDLDDAHDYNLQIFNLKEEILELKGCTERQATIYHDLESQLADARKEVEKIKQTDNRYIAICKEEIRKTGSSLLDVTNKAIELQSLLQQSELREKQYVGALHEIERISNELCSIS